MKLLNISTQDKSKGLTLIEVLIVCGIIMLIGTIGVIAGTDSYQKYLFRSDLDTAAALLSKARSSAIHSIGGNISHGVYFGDPDNFVLFRGSTYGEDSTFDLNIDKSKVTSVVVTGSGDEVVFTPLSGASASTTISISNGIQSFDININEEGGMDW